MCSQIEFKKWKQFFNGYYDDILSKLTHTNKLYYTKIMLNLLIVKYIFSINIYFGFMFSMKISIY